MSKIKRFDNQDYIEFEEIDAVEKLNLPVLQNLPAVNVSSQGDIVYSNGAMYYFNGTQWVLMSNASPPSTSHYIVGGNTLATNSVLGSLNNYDLILERNSQEYLRLNSSEINLSKPLTATQSVTIGGSTLFNNPVTLTSNLNVNIPNGYLKVNNKNVSSVSMVLTSEISGDSNLVLNSPHHFRSNSVPNNQHDLVNLEYISGLSSIYSTITNVSSLSSVYSTITNVSSLSSVYLSQAGGTMTGTLNIANIDNNAGSLSLGSNVNTLNLACGNLIQTVNIGANNSTGQTIINIGSTSGNDVINMYGTVVSILTTNTDIADKLITLNKNGGVSTGQGCGFQIEENEVNTGYIKSSSDRTKYEMKAPANNFILTTPALTQNEEIATTANISSLSNVYFRQTGGTITGQVTINSLLTLGPNNTTNEGGQVDLIMSDGIGKWSIDSQGATTSQDFRVFRQNNGGNADVLFNIKNNGNVFIPNSVSIGSTLNVNNNLLVSPGLLSVSDGSGSMTFGAGATYGYISNNLGTIMTTFNQSSGNVGINNLNAPEKLCVGPNSTSLRITENPGAYSLIGTNTEDGTTNTRIVLSGANRTLFNGNIEYLTVTSGSHIFLNGHSSNSGSELMRIESGGNVGIGTNSPAYKLDVAGTVNATDLKINGVSVSTDGGLKKSVGIFKLVVSGGNTYTYSFVRGNNMGLGVNTYANEIAWDAKYTTTPSNIYSWSISVTNTDNDSSILHAKFTGGIPSSQNNKLKVFSGSGVALSSLSNGDYFAAVTVIHD